MATKRQLITQAFGEAGLASYIYTLRPEQWQQALIRMDRMMAQWDSVGIRVGYLLARQQDESDLDDESGAFLYAENAIALQLALQIAPAYGKIVSEDAKASAKTAYSMLLTANYSIPEMRYPQTMPTGAGNKQLPNAQVFYFDEDRLTTGNDGELNLEI